MDGTHLVTHDGLPLVIIDAFDVGGTCGGPDETETELIVDTYCMLADTVARQGLELVVRGRPQIGQDLGAIKEQELALQNLHEPLESPTEAPFEHVLRLRTAEGLDHVRSLTRRTCYVKRTGRSIFLDGRVPCGIRSCTQ